MLGRTIVLMGSSFVGKALAFVREILLARFFGAGPVVDAFRAGMHLVIAPLQFFTADALFSALVPQVRQADQEAAQKGARAHLKAGTLFLLPLSVVVALLLFFAPSPMVGLVFPGFDAQTHDLTVRMLRICALGVPPYVLASVIIGWQMGKGGIALLALRPWVQNLGVIVATVLAALGENPVAVAWGFSGAYLFFVAVALGWLAMHLARHPAARTKANALREAMASFWKALRPMALNALVGQGMVLTEKLLASLVGVGTVAALAYAQVFPDSVLFLFVAPVGAVGLTAMAAISHEAFVSRLRTVTLALVAMAMPLSAVFATLAPEIVQVFYVRGAFDEAAAQATSAALFAMGFGMWAHALSAFMQKALSARGQNGAVFKVGVVGVVVNLVFDLLTYRQWGISGLAIGHSLRGCVRLVGFLWVLKVPTDIWLGVVRGVVLFIINVVAFVFAIGPALSTVTDFWVRLTALAGLQTLYWALCFLIFAEVREALSMLIRRMLKRGGAE